MKRCDYDVKVMISIATTMPTSTTQYDNDGNDLFLALLLSVVNSAYIGEFVLVY